MNKTRQTAETVNFRLNFKVIVRQSLIYILDFTRKCLCRLVLAFVEIKSWEQRDFSSIEFFSPSKVMQSVFVEVPRTFWLKSIQLLNKSYVGSFINLWSIFDFFKWKIRFTFAGTRKSTSRQSLFEVSPMPFHSEKIHQWIQTRVQKSECSHPPPCFAFFVFWQIFVSSWNYSIHCIGHERGVEQTDDNKCRSNCFRQLKIFLFSEWLMFSGNVPCLNSGLLQQDDVDGRKNNQLQKGQGTKEQFVLGMNMEIIET